MTDPSQKAMEFIESVGVAVLEEKPDARLFEIVGTIYIILSKALEIQIDGYNKTNSSQEASGEGTPGEPEQVQGTGITGGIKESKEGIRKESRGLTKSGRKKRR